MSTTWSSAVFRRQNQGRNASCPFKTSHLGQICGIMHFTNRAFVLSADYADYADKNQENLRSSVKSADSRHKSLSTA
jgi:hypothetical protein